MTTTSPSQPSALEQGGPVSLRELCAAWAAIQDGEFRHASRRPATPPSKAPASWHPGDGEQVVLVAGCHGSAGTSTVALALATAAGDARVVETCSAANSGLAAAAQAELGPGQSGWILGARDQVGIERRGDRITDPAQLPTPTLTASRLTIVDSSWDLDALLTGRSWLETLAHAAPSVVLVARATIPGLRRLETCIELVGARRATAVIVGAPAKLWPPTLAHGRGPLTRDLQRARPLVSVPWISRLSMSGLTPDDLPGPVVAAASHVLACLEGTLR